MDADGDDSAPGSPLADPALAAALDLVAAGVAGLQAVDLAAVADADVRVLIEEVERAARRVGSLQVDVLGEVDRRGLHAVDGHSSAKVMVRHMCSLSGGEASAREQVRRALLDLPAVAVAYRDGNIGTDQVRLIGRVHANKRVRDALPAQQESLISDARHHSYKDFERRLRTWERLVDQDGTCDDNERNHENRDAKLIQHPFDLSWELTGRFGAMQGALMREILDHYIQAEWEADWAKARAEHGDSACEADLARDDAKRRADAVFKIFQDAASAPPGSTTPEIVHNIMWDAETYLAFLRCVDPDPCGPESAGPGPVDLDRSRYRCETLDGTPLEPFEAAVSSLVAQVRRVLVNSAGVVIDLGRRARLFTGSARLAIQLQSSQCIWPGCWVPTSQCEADHLQPHGQGGATSPANGAPLCGRHNRWKQKGYATWRDPTGTWHTYRPDGTEIA